MRGPLPRAFLLPLAGLVWLAPAVLSAQQTLDQKAAADAYEQRISKDLNPFTAASFLRDQAVLEWLNGDPERQARLVAQATQLKDLSELLSAHDGAVSLVDALAIRLKDQGPDGQPPYFGFGPEPAKFIAWNDHWKVLGNTEVLRKALLEYDLLSPNMKTYLNGEKIDEAAWKATSFEKREAALRKWAEMVYGNIKAANPRSQADADKLRDAGREIAAFLDPSDKRQMWARVNMADQAVKGFAELDKRAAQLNTPELQSLLRDAQNGGSVEATLTALSQIFDKLGIPNKALQSQRPTSAADKLNDGDRGLLGTMLGSSLMAQTAGTDAGRDLTAFFKTHRMKVLVTELPSNLAEFRYAGKELVFNEKFIMDWAKSNGLTGHDLVTNSGALTRLSMLLVPNFVHEARHQQQMAWAEENGVRQMPGQNFEVEAKGVEALFFLQKSKNDPAFAKFYADSRDGSMLAREEIYLASQLNRGAPMFRNVVMSEYYEGLPSLDALAAERMRDHQAAVAWLRGELERRKKLSRSEQNALEHDGKDYAKGQQFKDAAEWRGFAAGLKTSVLEKDLKDDLSSRDNVVKAYRLHSQRSDNFQDQLDDGLQKLRQGGTVAGNGEVPAPR